MRDLSPAGRGEIAFAHILALPFAPNLDVNIRCDYQKGRAENEDNYQRK